MFEMAQCCLHYNMLLLLAGFRLSLLPRIGSFVNGRFRRGATCVRAFLRAAIAYHMASLQWLTMLAVDTSLLLLFAHEVDCAFHRPQR